VVEAVEALLGVGIADFADDGSLRHAEGEVPLVVLEADEWGPLVAPVAPITIDNPDAIEVPGVRFPAGDVALEPEAVGPYLAARNPGESDLNRMVRHQVFWEAWMAAIAASADDAAVPGEQSTGLGLYLKTLADGEAGFVVPEASTYRVPGAPTDSYLVDQEWLDALVPAMVPFPTAPSAGARPVVEVLDGTGTPDASIAVARMLAGKGAEIRSIGNGAVFDATPTRIIYYDEASKAAAEAIREQLGAGKLELTPSLDEVATVTVVLGPDVVDGLDLATGDAAGQ
jgi:hypothetical protein